MRASTTSIVTTVLVGCLLASLAPAQGSRGQRTVRFGENPLAVDREAAAVELKLKSMKVSLDFEETSLADVFEFIHEISGINIVIDPSVYEERDEEDLQVTLDVDDLTLDSCIQLILDLKGLSRRYVHGVMMISTPEAQKGDMFFKVYDVRDIMLELKDFPGPEITLAEEDFGTNIIDIHSDDDGPSNPLSDPDTIIDLIETSVAPESWSEEGAALNLRGGLLIITNTREVHRQVARFLDELRSLR